MCMSGGLTQQVLWYWRQGLDNSPLVITSEHHQCNFKEPGDSSRAAGPNPAKPEERCLPK